MGRAAILENRVELHLKILTAVDKRLEEFCEKNSISKREVVERAIDYYIRVLERM